MKPPLDHLPRGTGPVFGIVPTKPIKSEISGKLTLTLVEGEFVRAIIENNDDPIRCFFIADMGDHWELALEHPPGCYY